MIDFIKEFDKFVSNYDMENERIKLKYNHSYRVMKLSEKYSKKIGFSKEDIELAKIIGLLHDIGRFEQVKLYNTFNDKESVDHALLGVKLLFEDGLISKFWDKEEDYEIIKYSILNHNKYLLEEIDDDRVMKHAKLIRDVDKLDIIFLEGKLDEVKLRATNDPITKEIKDSFYRHETIDLKYKKVLNDFIVLYFAFIYDLNYKECLIEMRNNLKYLYNVIGHKEIFKDYYDEICKYVEERID